MKLSMVKHLVLLLLCLFIIDAKNNESFAQDPTCQCRFTAAFCATFVCPDVSLFTCMPAAAAHATTISAVTASLTTAMAAHSLFLEQFWMKDGLVASLTEAAKQISIGHNKQVEMLSTLIDKQIHEDTARLIQLKKVESAIATQPSEKSCEFATMKAGLLAAENSGAQKLQEDLNFMGQSALSYKNSVSDSSRTDASQRVNVVCDYADPNIAGGALKGICGGATPSDEKMSHFFLASVLKNETLDDTMREPINSAMLSVFFEDAPSRISKEMMKNDDMKVAYMNHRSVASKEMLSAYCFRKTFEDQMGGNSISKAYQEALYSELGLSPDEIQAKLGDNPSAYAQKQLLVDQVMNPAFGIATLDTVNNVLALANGIQAQKLSSLYDTLETLHCNELILSQLLNDALQPTQSDLQERLDVLEARVRADKNNMIAQNALSFEPSAGEVTQ